METLKLARPLVNSIMTQAQHSPELEICGLLGGIDGRALNCYPVTNQATDPSHRYRMDPSQQIEAMRQMREAGEELIAIYHSHPDAPALPSITDINEANYPEAIYLIVSLNTTGVLEMTAFTIRDGQAQELTLELE